MLTLIRLLLQGKSHLQCGFTDIIISPVCCDKQLNLGVKSPIDIWRKSIHSLGQTIYYNWETY